MPFANEHASRQTDPDKYKKIRRQNDKFGAGIHAIFGVLEDGTTELQSVRFDSGKFTAAEARKWLTEHDMKTSLEEATGKAFLVKSEKQRYTLGVVYEPDVLDTDEEFTDATELEKACWNFMRYLQSGFGLAKTGLDALRQIVRVAKGEQEEIEIPLEEIEKVGAVGVMHQDWEGKGEIVECYTMPCDATISGQLVKQGSWMIGVVWSEQEFAKIESGEIIGYSMGGTAQKTPAIKRAA